jgi:serine/threonine protein kinase
MTEKHAMQEYNEIQSIKKKLQTIPDYARYFMVDGASVCKPNKLTTADLSNFSKKCTALPKHNITASNINQSLDGLLSLNMPYGGIPVDDFVYQVETFDELAELNNSLKSLLLHGIIPMNKRNVYHSDVKDSNVLVDSSSYSRLIDWGLSVEYEPHKNQKFPNNWRNRPLQFNVPFSVIIFTDHFVTKYTAYLENDGTNNGLKRFVLDYIHFWMKKRGLGHYKMINEIMYILFHNDLKDTRNKWNKIETDYTIVYITNYIVAILENYTTFKKDGSLDLRKYLDEVFIHIIDVWGFVIAYLPILEFLDNNYSELTANQMQIFVLLKRMFLKYLYEPRIVPIDTDELIESLDRLDDLFQSQYTPSSSSSSSSLYYRMGRGLTRKLKRTKRSRTKRRTVILSKSFSNYKLKRRRKNIA